jgi:threonine/homoserine/homoserine lactone efflux protein
VGVFYIATFPQFIPAGTSPLLMGVLLAGVHCLLSMAWFTLLIRHGLRRPLARGRPKHPHHQQHHGSVLVGFGVKLALGPAH